MNENQQISPWICHVCGGKFSNEPAVACSSCYKIACRPHMENVLVKNPEFGQLEMKLICSACSEAADEPEAT